MISHFFSWGIFGVALMAMALVHFVRRQPSFYWLYLIIFLGPLGALIYLAIEFLPELFDPGAFRFLERGRRVREVELNIRQNPSAGNYEELGLLRLDKGDWSGARACFDKALAQRTSDAGYDFQRAAGLLAYADWKTGDLDRAQRLFDQVLRTSTLTETQLHYAEFLAATDRREEAKQQALRIKDKRAGMPGFQRRRERKLFWKNSSLLRKL